MVLWHNPLFQMAVSKIIHLLLFSRYEVGMSYATLLDNALMGNQEKLRDISLTLFLNKSANYQGGELVIENIEGELTFKLEVGEAVVYPSSTLHRVEPVTEGVRLVTVGWVQSFIRDPMKREILVRSMRDITTSHLLSETVLATFTAHGYSMCIPLSFKNF